MVGNMQNRGPLTELLRASGVDDFVSELLPRPHKLATHCQGWDLRHAEGPAAPVEGLCRPRSTRVSQLMVRGPPGEGRGGESIWGVKERKENQGNNDMLMAG